jgi:predicted anti-sigma-YlaC factor YlaD
MKRQSKALLAAWAGIACGYAVLAMLFWDDFDRSDIAILAALIGSLAAIFPLLISSGAARRCDRKPD